MAKVEILKTSDYNNIIIDYDFFNDNLNEKILNNEKKKQNEDGKELNEEEINKKKSEIYHNLLIQRDVHKCKINIQNSKYIKDKTPQSSPILLKNIDVNFTEMLGDLDLKLHNSLSLAELGKNIKEKEDEE